MRGQCLDEGIIQSYLDGELSSALMEKTAAHLVQCDICALLLSEAQEELEMFSAAFEPLHSASVPSETLREKINAAIIETQKLEVKVEKTSSIRNWLSSITTAFVFKPQYAIGFASVLIAVLFGAFFFINTHNELVNVDGGDIQISWIDKWPETSNPNPTTPTASPVVAPKASVGKKKNKITVKGEVKEPKALSGEQSYLDAIASLQTAVQVQGDLSLRPTLRVEYERNLAMIDNAIQSTQKQARQNPKDEGSAKLLYASYQSKIDLLSAVSNQAQLSASLR